MDETYFDVTILDRKNHDYSKEVVLVTATEIDDAYSPFIILTSFEDIHNLFDGIREDRITHNPKCWKKCGVEALRKLDADIKQYSHEELSSFRENNKQKYVDWTTKVLQFYCLRAALFERNGKPIKKFRVPTTLLRTLPKGQLRDNCVAAYNRNHQKVKEMNDK
jgi:hypothetical protein